MNFVFDTLHYRSASGGPGRVTEELVRAMRNLGEAVYTAGPDQPDPSRLKLLVALLRRAATGRLEFRTSGTEKPVLVAGEIWPSAVPNTTSVIIIHDMFALDRPEWTKPVERIFQARRIGWAERYSDLVLAPSAEVKQALVSLRPALKDKTAVVPWGISQEFKNAAASGQSEKPYWVASGDMTPRKGLTELLAWYRGYDCPPRLLLTGHLPSTHLPNGVTLTGRLALADLARTIARASLFLSFSHDEGFGLSIAEAAATGTPVVARRFPGGAERFPSGIHWFDSPAKAGAIVQTALSSPRTPPSWARELSWERTAEKIRSIVLQIH